MQQRHGADVNYYKKTEGQTLLMEASENGLREKVEILLENGADVNIKNIRNETARTLALRNGHTVIAATLVESRAMTKSN